MKIKTIFFLLISGISYGQSQNRKEMTANNNPLLCDPETGVCEIPGTVKPTAKQEASLLNKPVKIIYFTDPICSSCWGIEPQLRKLKLEYGDEIEIDYRMGGLLPDWSYNSGGISKPSDVAHHWDEVSLHYKMPIDGDVWLEDPLDSSYPPSIAFKAAQLQDEKKAIVFLRNLREMVFLQKKNITKWEVIEQAALRTGLDATRLKQDYNGKAKELFEEDLKLAKKMGVRGFPSIFVSNAAGTTEFIYGTKPYATYESGVQKIYPEASAKPYKKDWESLFDKYPTLTLREFAELGEVSFQEAEQTLEKLVAASKLKKFATKNGAIWIRE